MSGIGPALDTALSDGAALAAAAVAGTAQSAQAVAAPAPVHRGSAPTAPDTGEAPVPASPDGGAAAAAAPAQQVASVQAAAKPAFGTAPDASGSIGGAVFALLLVIGLIVALGWLARRMPGVARNLPGSGLRVVASMALGARERLVVVEVGGTQLLVGVGAGGMRTLHTLAEPLPPAPPPAVPPFAQLLAQQFGKKA